MSNRGTLPLIRFELDDFTDVWSRPAAPVVLLHPGLGGNDRLYRAWVPVLADQYRVLRVTARGQGGTPRPEGYEWSLDGFVQDAIDVLDHLDVERVHWVGASGGGIMGQCAALTQPSRIASLSLIATTARFRGPAGNYDEWLAPLDQGDHRVFLERDTERRFGTDNPARTKWIINELCRTPASVSAEMHRWVRGVDLVEQLPNIACPALIVTGEKDTLTDVGDANILADRIPESQVEILPGYPHNIAYTHPREVATIVRGFIDQVEASRRN